MALREWASPDFSKGKVDKAGSNLFSHDLFEYGEALGIVDNWRSAHNYSRGELQKASDAYLAVEKSNKGSNKDTVLVSVDSLAALRKAYPNYFLDTKFFSTLAAAAVRE